MNERYQRQLLLPEIGEEGQEKLRRARVLIVGVGGLGSPIALYLTGAGVGTIGLVDDDVVSLNNLHRQVLYSEAEVGQSKAACAARRLGGLNSEVCIEPHPMRLTAANARDLIARYDLVIDGCDNFATRFLLSDTCSALGRPYIYGAICGLEGQVAVLCHGKEACTYRTLFPDEEATLQMPHPGRQVAGVTPAIVGSVEAGEALKLICGYGEPLINRLWTIDLRTLQSYILDL
ncbi:MAG: HesA/MoeB/ThiF family protein [Bacteroides sp.]|nr:HesA/MoeB/ThiF family protein [Bacteroides sp.]